MKNRTIHFEGLNSIRAIAALSVIASHVFQAFEFFNLPKSGGLISADQGVTMFFTLSGFLITYLLLVEKKNSDSISIKKFYLRRILRIWPLYYLYIFLVLISLFVFQGYYYIYTHIFWLPFYLFLAGNVPYILQAMGDTGFPLIGHYWSLGVEEQFYLVWPWIVSKRINLVRWLTIFIGVFIGLKIIAWFYYRSSGNTIPLYSFSITRFDSMAFGALGAVILFDKEKYKKIFRIIFSISMQIIIILSLILWLLNKFNFMGSLMNPELFSLVTIILILNITSNQRCYIKLNYRVLDFLGKISYGIYVYHVLIIFFLERLLRDFAAGYYFKVVIIFISVYGLTIIISFLSYKFFEKPILNFKRKFEVVNSSN